MTAIAIRHKDEIIHRMSKGEPITAIAQSLGYASHQGIIERLGQDPDYQAALRSGIVGKIEKREEQLESASDNVAVTRADRLLGHARWWAERLDPARFGQKQQLDVRSHNIEIVRYVADVQQSTAPLPVIDGDATRIEPK